MPSLLDAHAHGCHLHAEHPPNPGQEHGCRRTRPFKTIFEYCILTYIYIYLLYYMYIYVYNVLYVNVNIDLVCMVPVASRPAHHCFPALRSPPEEATLCDVI